MLDFEDSYFEDEVICGFLVEKKMKHAWAAFQEVLAEIIRVCEKYQITYFADYGTLLGAVRHQNFVPWDDDIDIAVKREDYNRLMKVLPFELPASFCVHSIYTNDTHRQPLGCVSNSDHVIRDGNIPPSFHGCPYIVGVDIYPLDYIPRDKELAETHKALYNVVYDAAQRYDELLESGELASYLPAIEELCEVSFDGNIPSATQLWRLADQIASLFSAEESDYVAWMPDMVLSEEGKMRKKEWYEESQKMKFGKLEVCAPIGYDELLKTLYGDYMVPVQGYSAHEYPFYKRQELL